MECDHILPEACCSWAAQAGVRSQKGSLGLPGDLPEQASRPGRLEARCPGVAGGYSHSLLTATLHAGPQKGFGLYFPSTWFSEFFGGILSKVIKAFE